MTLAVVAEVAAAVVAVAAAVAVVASSADVGLSCEIFRQNVIQVK